MNKTEKKKEISSWINRLEKYDKLTYEDIIYLRNNIPEKMYYQTKAKIYKLIDNYCLKNTGCKNKDEMEIYLNILPFSLTCKLYDLKFFVANKGK